MATVSSPPATSAPKTSHPFTCMTCSIAFRSSELQRGHMRSDWHRYNLKRRVASLPPLSSEVFAEKVLSAQALSKATADKASFEKHCQACNKTYFSENAFRNHLGSQRHRMNEAVSGANVDDASVSSVVTSTVSLGGEPIVPEDVEDPAVTAEFQEVINSMKDSRLDDVPVSRRPSRPHHSAELERRGTAGSVADTASQVDTVTSTAMPINRCLFCNFDSVNLEASVMHMGKSHGLFIPEREFLDDLEGLVAYLQAKVTENMECICCHKLKHTVSGVQTHMRDKSHCKIAFDTEDELLEIGQFYDFRATYSDDESDETSGDEEDEDIEKRRAAKLGAVRQAESEDSDDEEWEDDSDDDEEKEAGISTKRSRRRTAQAYEVDGELYLPSGRAAGHRSGLRYFRQNLRNYPTADERAEQKLLTDGDHEAGDGETATKTPETALTRRKAYEANRAQLVSRANGGLGMTGVSADVKRTVAKEERRERRRGQRTEDHLRHKMDAKLHLRDPPKSAAFI